MNGMLRGHAVHPVKQGLSWLTGRRVPAGGCLPGVVLAAWPLLPPASSSRLPLCGFLLWRLGVSRRERLAQRQAGS